MWSTGQRSSNIDYSKHGEVEIETSSCLLDQTIEWEKEQGGNRPVRRNVVANFAKPISLTTSSKKKKTNKIFDLSPHAQAHNNNKKKSGTAPTKCDNYLHVVLLFLFSFINAVAVCFNGRCFVVQRDTVQSSFWRLLYTNVWMTL